MNAVMPRLTTFADGITAVDTEYVRPQMDASHIVVAGDRAAIVDTGPNTAVPLILAALERTADRARRGGAAVPHPRAPRSCRRRRRADARAAARHLRGASARRASHDRSRETHRGHPRGVRRRAVFEALRRNPAHRSRTPRHRAGRPALRARRPHVRVRAHARPRAASPGHRRSRRHQHLHRRHLRPVVPRVRYGEGRVDHAHHHAHAVRSRAAQGLDRAAHAVPAAPPLSHALQRSRAIARGSPTTWSTPSTNS